ncbi:unnamed protein product [Cuscuta epithymum]|uniref:DUF4283 domain-containing protein n=1 Tax=Cuscuta epithymum TaxID=186058 RepID=A0AAV0EAW8_9ASTE|nr:unnamed protein product [Cuscuta epithymum]
MARKKLTNAESSLGRVTRSTASFNLLDGLDEELHTLGNATPATLDVGVSTLAGLTAKAENVSKPGQIVAKIPGQSVPKLVANKEKRKETELRADATHAGGSSPLVHGQTTVIPTSSGTANPWSSLFKDNRAPSNGFKLRYIPPSGTTIDFSDRIMPSMVEMWGFCLVGCFTGKFPGLKAIYDLKNTWGVKCIIKPHDKGWVLFKFQSEDDRTKVLKEGPYTIFGKLLMLKALSDDFSFDDEEFLKVPIWVKFPNLHLKLWNEDALSEIASMVGVPLATDKVTHDRSNHHFARVLIEVDISKPPPLSFPIRLPSRKVVKQFVVYETFPNFCFHCKIYGHHPFICNKLAQRNDETVSEKVEDEQIKIGGKENIPAEIVETVELAAQRAESAQEIHPTVQGHNPAGTATTPIGTATKPTGFNRQTDSKDAQRCPEVVTSSNEQSVVALEDIERVVTDENDLHQHDVVTKCEMVNGKTLKLVVKPFRFVRASVIRVDTSLRLTDDLDKKGLTFTARCLEGLPGVTKKKGEVCFDAKFTTPFRAFFGYLD